jgi:hypothetical protein
MDDDITLWEAFRNRRLPKEMSDSMQGDLTMEELNEALFKHMNGSLRPGMDDFTVNCIIVFWPECRHLVKDELNSIQKNCLPRLYVVPFPNFLGRVRRPPWR